MSINILDTMRRGRLNRTPDELVASLKTRYENKRDVPSGGWYPGPNANYRLIDGSPSQLAQKIYDKKKGAASPIGVGGKSPVPPAAKQEPKSEPPAKSESPPAPASAPAAAQSPASKPLGSGVKPKRIRDSAEEGADASGEGLDFEFGANAPKEEAKPETPASEPVAEADPQEKFTGNGDEQTPDAMARKLLPKVAPEVARKVFDDAVADGRFSKWVKEAVSSAVKHNPKVDQDQVESVAQMAVWKAAQNLRKGEEGNPNALEGLARKSIARAKIDESKGQKAQKRGEGKTKQTPDEFDAADPKSASKPNKDETTFDKEAMRKAVASLPEDQQKLIGLMNDGFKGEELAKEMGMSKATVSRRLTELSEALKQHGQEHFFNEMFGEKWRYEYGPRHSPPKRIDGAVARLQALAEYAGEIDDEALEDEVTGIAREFSADDLKAIAKKFGIKRGISTKAATLESLLAKVCEGKEV